MARRSDGFHAGRHGLSTRALSTRYSTLDWPSPSRCRPIGQRSARGQLPNVDSPSPSGSLSLMPAISKRTAQLGTENAFVVLAEVTALQRAGKDIIMFSVGQPDFLTPVHVQDKAIE